MLPHELFGERDGVTLGDPVASVEHRHEGPLYPQRVPTKIGVDFVSNTLIANPQCGPTRELPDFPKAYYDLCGAP